MNVLQINKPRPVRQSSGISEKDKELLRKFLDTNPKDSYGMRFLMRNVS